MLYNINIDCRNSFDQNKKRRDVTKDFTAGKPLTTTSIKYSNDSSKPAKGYSPVHCFGEEECFNLNEHQFDSAIPVYLSFKQSNAKKTAEKVPGVIATNITYGIAALTGVWDLLPEWVLWDLSAVKRKEEVQYNEK